MLRLFAELVLSVVSTLGMRLRRKQRDWHAHAAPEALPPMKSDNQETLDRRAPARQTRDSAYRNTSATHMTRGMFTHITAWGLPPLGKGRSERARLATGGDHFVPRLPNQVIPTPISLREMRTSLFQGEVKTAPA